MLSETQKARELELRSELCELDNFLAEHQETQHSAYERREEILDELSTLTSLGESI